MDTLLLIQFVMCFAGSADVGLFKSMMKDQDCLAEAFMSYKETVGKLDEKWKGE